MKKILLTDLSESVRQLLMSAGDDEPVVIEDEGGQVRYGVIPYRRPTAQEKLRAWERLREIQNKAARSMEEQGITEDDLMRELLVDD